MISAAREEGEGLATSAIYGNSTLGSGCLAPNRKGWLDASNSSHDREHKRARFHLIGRDWTGTWRIGEEEDDEEDDEEEQRG